eukprot:m.346611 g.346611  ORF g.346611 m.346611 type:complete len:216 (-) comp29619_c0_seq1:47-694(-)
MNSEQPVPVHRLDKNTTGITIFARNRPAASLVSGLIRDWHVTKKYYAVCNGEFETDIGAIISKNPGRKKYNQMPRVTTSTQFYKHERKTADSRNIELITNFRVISSNSPQISLIELQPVTGFKHQLRVHCAALECPIMGDELYGRHAGNNGISRWAKDTLHPWLDLSRRVPFLLHAYEVMIPGFGPTPGDDLVIRAPVPPIFKHVCKRLDLPNEL